MIKAIKVTTLTLLLLSFTQNTAHADEIKTCKQKHTDMAQLIFCVSTAAAEKDNIRKMIEQDFITIINEDRFIPKPELETYIPNQGKKTNAKKEIKRAETISASNKAKLNEHMAQKKKAIADLKESTKTYAMYRFKECGRQQERFLAQGKKAMGTIQRQACIYYLSIQRIKALEESIR